MKPRGLSEWLGWLLLPINLLALLDLSVVDPNDFWWHVRIGELIAKTHAVPVVEPFSFVREGERWVNQPWLMQLWMSTLYHSGGLALVVFAHAVTITLGYAIVFVEARRRGGGDEAPIACILGACVGAANWGVRPQEASFLAFGVLVALLEWDRSLARTTRRTRLVMLAAFAALFAAWSNLHGAFTFGLLAVGVHFGVRAVIRVRSAKSAGEPMPTADVGHAVAIVLVSSLAANLNPEGVRGTTEHVLMFFEQGGVGFAGNQEFAPLTIRTADGAIFAFAVGRLAWAGWKGGRWPRAEEAALLLVFGVLTLSSRRVAPWFGMLLVVPLARTMVAAAKEAKPTDPKRAGSRRMAIAAVSLALFIATLPWLRRSVGLPGRSTLAAADTPVDATRFLCERLPDGEHVYFEQALASYAEWGCPKLRVMLDTRIQAFSAAAWEDYVAIEGARFDWERVLAKWHVRWLMVRTDDARILAAAKDSPHFREMFRDDVAVVFGPADPD